MSTHLTTQELDAARAKYRGKIIAVGSVGDGCRNGSPSGLQDRAPGSTPTRTGWLKKARLAARLMCRSSNNGWIARSRFRSIFLRCVSRIQDILKMHWLNVRA